MRKFITVKIHLEMRKHEVVHKPRKQHIGLMAHGLPAVRDMEGEAWAAWAAPAHAEGL